MTANQIMPIIMERTQPKSPAPKLSNISKPRVPRNIKPISAFLADSTLSDGGILKQNFPAAGTSDSLIHSALRLRYILHQLNRGELPLDDLKKNLEYAALVLETAYMDETRRLCEEDDELSEVTPETVPEEVREWLASTFTRQSQGRSNREKPKFKSVANAIRTGIFFDKMFRRISGGAQAPIPGPIAAVLRDINNWSFDPFHLNDVSKNSALKYVGFELFNKYGFLTKFKTLKAHLRKASKAKQAKTNLRKSKQHSGPFTSTIHHTVLDAFLSQLEAGYSKYNNPYHNLVHGADVAQTTHWMISQTGLIECLTELEAFAAIYAALIHDYEHTGHTNNFHVQSGSDLALLYNDRSVLENHHVSSCFRLMKDSDKNLLSTLSKEEYRDFRNLVVEIILATDMSTHFVQAKTMKNMLALPESIDKVKAICFLVHCCDIGHPAKSWKLHHRWTMKVLEEFFRQGDLEASLGLPYSPLCDRTSTHVAESQIGFIDFIVEPSMVVCTEMVVKMVEPLVHIPPKLDESSDETGHSRSASVSSDSSNNQSTSSGQSSDSIGSLTFTRKLPLNHDGRLCIPQPWFSIMQENKNHWKAQAAVEEEQRKKQERSNQT